MSKKDQNGKSSDTYWWGKASKHSKMRCYITAWDVFLSFLGDSEMFLEFVVKGAKCHEDMAHSAFLGQFCVEAIAEYLSQNAWPVELRRRFQTNFIREHSPW